LLAEAVEADNLLGRAAGLGGCLGLYRLLVGRWLSRRLVGPLDVELQAELHRRIEEAFDGGEGDTENLSLAVEGKADLEACLGDLEVPELVLQNDGHLLVVLLEQTLADSDARRLGDKGDEEVVLSGKTGSCDFGQDLADDPPQSFLGEDV